MRYNPHRYVRRWLAYLSDGYRDQDNPPVIIGGFACRLLQIVDTAQTLSQVFSHPRCDL